MWSSGWYRVQFCVSCNEELDDLTVMYSNGICPKCGNMEPGTIVDTKSRSARTWYPNLIEWLKGKRPYREYR